MRLAQWSSQGEQRSLSCGSSLFQSLLVQIKKNVVDMCEVWSYGAQFFCTEVVSTSTSLLIRHNKVREGCVYLNKVHSSEEAHASVTSSFLKRCPVNFSEEPSG